MIFLILFGIFLVFTIIGVILFFVESKRAYMVPNHLPFLWDEFPPEDEEEKKG